MEREIRLVCTTSRTELPCIQEEQLLHLLIELVPMGETTQARMPLDICLTLDCSSSMRGDRLAHAREAARYMVNQLTPTDYFCLIVFNDQARVVIPRQQVQAPAGIREHINEIQASGGTEMARAIEGSLEQMQHLGAFSSVRRIILLTDGQTYGDEDRCVELAREAQKQGIGLTALGVGDEWNEDLLATMAAHGNSRSEYIAGADAIIPIFREEMRLLQGIMAQEMSLSLHPVPGVTVRNFFRVLPEVSPLPLRDTWEKEQIVPLGEWMGASAQVFLAELVLSPLAPGEHELLRVTLSYRSPQERGRKHAHCDVALTCVLGEEASAELPAKVRQSLEKLTAFRLQEAAWEEARQGNIDGATRRLQAVATRLVHMGEEDLARIVEAEALRLERTGRTSAVGKKEIRYGTQRLGRGASEQKSVRSE
jgi:Ca-activated chloride channel family protein